MVFGRGKKASEEARCLVDEIFSSPGDLDWRKVEALVKHLRAQPNQADDVASILKNFVRDRNPEYVLISIMILDSLALNAPQAMMPVLGHKKWRDRLFEASVRHDDQFVRRAARQFIVNLAHHFQQSPIGDTYSQYPEWFKEARLDPARIPRPREPEPLRPFEGAVSGAPIIRGIDYMAEARAGDQASTAAPTTPAASAHYARGYDTPSAAESGRRRDTDGDDVFDILGDEDDDNDISMMTTNTAAHETPDELVSSFERDVTALVEAVRHVASVRAAHARNQATQGALTAAVVSRRDVAETCRNWNSNSSQHYEMVSQDGDATEERLLQRFIDCASRSNAAVDRWDLLVGLCSNDGAASDPAFMSTIAALASVTVTTIEQDPTQAPAAAAPPLSARGAAGDAASAQMAAARALEEYRVLAGETGRLRAALQEAGQQYSAAEEKHAREIKELKSTALLRVKGLMEEKGALERQLGEAEGRLEALEGELTEATSQASARGAAARGGEAARAEVEAVLVREAARRKEVEEKRDRIAKELAQAKEKIARLEMEVEEKEAAMESAMVQLRSEKEAMHSQLSVLRAQMETIAPKLESVEALEREAAECRSAADRATARLAGMEGEYKRETMMRKQLHNQLRELKGNIRVLARVRPVLPFDGELKGHACGPLDEYTVGIRVPRGEGDFQERKYEFDHCFDGAASQEEVFSEAQALVQSALDGYNVCVFCYGQTGSGKTHTIFGTEGNLGILPRAIEDLFSRPGVTATVTMLELYMDNLVDLMGDRRSAQDLGKTRAAELKIARGAGGLIEVQGAVKQEVASAAEASGLLKKGIALRSTASTKKNDRSSRSHMIFSMVVEAYDQVQGTRARSRMSFIDLAGSERVAKSGSINDEQRLKEATAINKSLSALADVVSALTKGESFVPYRNHKLTQLMSDSLGGSAKTLMVVNLSPLEADAGETKLSLDYASRVKLVRNNASRSFETRETARLEKIIDELTMELEMYRGADGDRPAVSASPSIRRIAASSSRQASSRTLMRTPSKR
ncbi:unnamed protein product [Pedinophyceae sp. YPF-701]|nr:unnamed protein product [Pedinophyceae sp. YPF-701]